MDVYKLKWKMRFRVKKLKGFFKLCEYNFRHKHNLEGDDQFYYYLQRQLMRDLVKADPEQEYLEEHGLLPEEEPEPEVESEVESEVEPDTEPVHEPGLIRTVDFLQLLSAPVNIFNTIFFGEEVKEFEDRTEITVQIMEGPDGDARTEHAVAPHQEGQRYDPVTLDGEAFRWDRAEGKLRFLPVVVEDAEQATENGPVRVVQELVLRVDKALAEERLSALCLEYACACSDTGYDWCLVDYSQYPVIYELDMVKDEVGKADLRRNLEFYCFHYYKEAGLDRRR